MNKQIKINLSNNPASNYGEFAGIIDNLKEIAEDKPMSEVINAFISDLMNYNTEGYTRKIQSISMNGLSSDTIKMLIKYMKTKKKEYQKQETKEKKQAKSDQMESRWEEIERVVDETIASGEQGTEIEILERLILAIKNKEVEYDFTSKERKYILKRLDERLEAANKKLLEQQEQEETGKRSVEDAIKQIEDILEREYNEGNIKNKAEYLRTIRDAIAGENEGINLGIELDEKLKQQLLQRLDEESEVKKDELYFEQVERFTSGFRFLKDYYEIPRAIYGSTKKIKFTDKESYERYCDLSEFLRKRSNKLDLEEYDVITRILEGKDFDNLDDEERKIATNAGNIRVLTARKDVIEREMEERKVEETR